MYVSTLNYWPFCPHPNTRINSSGIMKFTILIKGYQLIHLVSIKLLLASICLGRQGKLCTLFSSWLSGSSCCGWKDRFESGCSWCNCRRKILRLPLRVLPQMLPFVVCVVFSLSTGPFSCSHTTARWSSLQAFRSFDQLSWILGRWSGYRRNLDLSCRHPWTLGAVCRLV